MGVGDTAETGQGRRTASQAHRVVNAIRPPAPLPRRIRTLLGRLHAVRGVTQLLGGLLHLVGLHALLQGGVVALGLLGEGDGAAKVRDARLAVGHDDGAGVGHDHRGEGLLQLAQPLPGTLRKSLPRVQDLLARITHLGTQGPRTRNAGDHQPHAEHEHAHYAHAQHAGIEHLRYGGERGNGIGSRHCGRVRDGLHVGGPRERPFCGCDAERERDADQQRRRNRNRRVSAVVANEERQPQSRMAPVTSRPRPSSHMHHSPNPVSNVP